MAHSYYTVTRYCHNRECRLFDQEVTLRVAKATFMEPEEWYDDPECRGCKGSLSGEYNEYEYDEEFYLE